MGLEPTKASFAGWCLDHFGITAKLVYPKLVPKSVPKPSL